MNEQSAESGVREEDAAVAAGAPAAEPVAEPEPPAEAEPAAEAEPPPEHEQPDPGVRIGEHLMDVNVRLWAELGRTRLPLADAVALGLGAIVDLDKEPDDALDVFVNGRLFARATLLLIDGEWAVRLEEVLPGAGAVEHASSAGSGA